MHAYFVAHEMGQIAQAQASHQGAHQSVVE